MSSPATKRSTRSRLRPVIAVPLVLVLRTVDHPPLHPITKKEHMDLAYQIIIMMTCDPYNLRYYRQNKLLQRLHTSTAYRVILAPYHYM